MNMPDEKFSYSSSPEDDDKGSVTSFSSSMFDRVENSFGFPPAMLPNGNDGCTSSVFPYAAVAPGGPSSIESTVSSIFAAHKISQQQQKGYGQLQEQYDFNNPPNEIGFTNNTVGSTASGSGGVGSSILDITSSNNVGGNGHNVGGTSSNDNSSGNGNQHQEEDAGRRQYQEIMSTPVLSTNGHHQNQFSTLSGENQNQFMGASNQTLAPVAASSSSFQHQPSNEGSGDNVLPVAPTSPPSSWHNDIDLNTKGGDGNRPMIFHGKGSFPLNLALMLESVERPWKDEGGVDDSALGSNGGKMNHIISWLPCGTGFVIHNTDLFLSEVLPRFFKSSKNTKIRSFYRKLNRWGFTVLRSSQLNQSGLMSSVKNAWHHPDFSRKRAVECLRLAQQSGDTDYSHLLSVTHVSFANGGTTGGASGDNDGGGKKRSVSKRDSEFSVESNMSCQSEFHQNDRDMDTTTKNEFNYSMPTLDSGLSSSNKRRGSLQDTSQRMSWTAGAPVSSHDCQGQGWMMGSNGNFATNNAATRQISNQKLTQSWTAGNNPAPSTSTWTAGNNPLNAPARLTQSWTTPGFAPNNVSQLSLIQFNQLMNNQFTNQTIDNNANNLYNQWKNAVMQSNTQLGSSSFGQDQQQAQQGWVNSNNTSQVTYAPQSDTNGNSFGSLVQSQEQQQQLSQIQQLQQQQQQQQDRINAFQQGQNQVQQQQPQAQDNRGHCQQDDGGALTQHDVDLRMFFEKFADGMGNDE